MVIFPSVSAPAPGPEKYQSLEFCEAKDSSESRPASQDGQAPTSGGENAQPIIGGIRPRSFGVPALALAIAVGCLGALQASRSPQTGQARTQASRSRGPSFVKLEEEWAEPAAAATPAAAAKPAAASPTSADAPADEESGECPACAPQAPISPDLVIPFFERDLCKLKTTAKSLSVNDPDGLFGDVYLLWVSTRHSKEYEEELTEAFEAISQTHKVHLIEFTDLMEFTDSLSGWHAQQVLKLKAASLVKAEYYVVLDSKNTLVRQLKQDDLFTKCNTAKIQAEFPAAKIPIPHIDWYKASAAALQMDPPTSGFWPASITPVVFHTQTVLDMLNHIEEGTSVDVLCDGPLCDMFGARDESGKGATEFTMYTLWAMSSPNFECIYNVQKMEHFKVEYSADWQGDLDSQLAEHGWDPSIVTVSGDDGFPMDWMPGDTKNLPKQSQFPLRIEDLSKRWAASLWRGMPETADLLAEVNIDTLNAVIGGKKQAPIMFGAQPASLVVMPKEKEEKALELLVELYRQAGLYDETQTPDELHECVVGLKN